MHLEEHRLGDQRTGRADGGVKAFQVARLGNAIVFPGQHHQFVSLGQRSCQRFLNQRVNAGFEQFASYLEMMQRRNRDRSCLDFAVRSEKLFEGSETTATEFPRNGIGSRSVRVYDSHEPDGFAFTLKLVIDAGMIPSKSSHTTNCDVDGMIGGQRESRRRVAEESIVNIKAVRETAELCIWSAGRCCADDNVPAGGAGAESGA